MRTFVSLVALALVALVSAPGGAVTPPEGLSKAERIAWEAGQLIGQGDLAAAEAKAQLALQVDSKLAAGHFRMAQIRLLQGKQAEAWQKAKQATVADPTYAPAQFMVVRIAAQQKQVAAEVSRLNQVAQQNPNHLGIQLAFGEAQLLAGQHPAAMRIARAVLKRAETSVDAMKLLARAYLGIGQDATAKAILERAIEIEKDPEAMLLVAGIFLQQDKLLPAKNWLEEAVKLDPAFVEGLVSLGYVYNRVRNFAAAEDALSKAVSLAPSYPEAWLNLGSAQRGLKKFEPAERSWKKVLDLDQRMADAWYNLGILYLENPLPGRDRIKQLEEAGRAFNNYKRGRQPDDKRLEVAEVDKYIGESKLLIEQEKQRKAEELKQPPAGEEPPVEGEGEAEPVPEDQGG